MRVIYVPWALKQLLTPLGHLRSHMLMSYLRGDMWLVHRRLSSLFRRQGNRVKACLPLELAPEGTTFSLNPAMLQFFNPSIRASFNLPSFDLQSLNLQSSTLHLLCLVDLYRNGFILIVDFSQSVRIVNNLQIMVCRNIIIVNNTITIITSTSDINFNPGYKDFP